MRKVKIVKLIVRLYFLGALIASAAHIITSANKLGLTGIQAYSTPALIDGIAVIGLVMRSAQFSVRTRKIGFRVQMIAGLLSLTANVFAGDNAGERIYGVMIVALFIFSEWLSDQIESAEVDRARELAEKRAASQDKARATREANKAAEQRIVKTSKRRMSKQLAAITTTA